MTISTVVATRHVYCLWCVLFFCVRANFSVFQVFQTVATEQVRGTDNGILYGFIFVAGSVASIVSTGLMFVGQLMIVVLGTLIMFIGISMFV